MKKKTYLFTSGTTENNLNIASLILRFMSGGFMIYQHGYPKFIKFFSDGPVEFINPFGIGATATLALVLFAEVICAIFVILGLMTRWALIPLIFTMAYAAFIVHANDGFQQKELALVYLIIFIVLLLLGPGKYSLDRKIRKRRSTV